MSKADLDVARFTFDLCEFNREDQREPTWRVVVHNLLHGAWEGRPITSRLREAIYEARRLEGRL